MDILSKQHQIEVERNNGSVVLDEWLNLSPFIEQDVIIQDSPLSFGVIKSTCVIQINPAINASIVLKRNWAQWGRGKKVSVKVKDSGGVLHQVKELFILKAKYDDGRRPLEEDPTNPLLTLELGDVLALRDTRDLETADNGVAWSGALPVVDYVNQWLNYFGLPVISQLPGDPRAAQTMIGPVSYNGGSVSEHLGKILYGYTQCHLYADRIGRLRLCQADRSPTAAFLTVNTLDLPVDRVSPSEAEMPAGIVHVTASPESATVRAALACTTSVTTTLNLRHTETVCTAWNGNQEIVTRTGNDEIIGINLGGTAIAPKGWTETITRVFSGAFSTLQSKTIVRTETPSATSGVSGVGQQIETKREEYEYEYDGIVNRKISANITTKPPSSNQNSVGISAYIIIIQEWIKRYIDTFVHLYYESRPLNSENSAEPTTTLDDGENQPPATQFKPSDFVLKTLQVTGKAEFSQTPGIDAKHQRTFPMGPYCPSNGAANAIAIEQGAWLIGRYHGQNLAYPIEDSWLNSPQPPIFYLFVTDEHNIQDVYLLNSHALFLGETQCYGGGAGIWLGTRDPDTGVITPPASLRSDYLITNNGDYYVTSSGDRILLGG